MILITGSTGHLGKATMAHLLKNTGSDRIVALARDEQKAGFLKEKSIGIRVGNFDDIESLDNAMQGISKVFLISGTETHRFQQHKNVIDAAKKAGVKHIVYTSVSLKDVNSLALANIMQSHFETEDYIKESGLRYTFLRNSLYADVIPMYVGEKVFETGVILPAGNGKVPFALRREMGEAAANVLLQDGHENKTYSIMGNELYSFEDVAQQLSVLSGRSVAYTDVDAASYKESLKQFEVPDFLITIITGFAADIKNKQYEILSGDLEQLLDRKPATLDNALKEIYQSR